METKVSDTANPSKAISVHSAKARGQVVLMIGDEKVTVKANEAASAIQLIARHPES